MTFVCAWCQKTEEQSEDDTELIAEYERYFGTFRPEDVVRICDDCYQKHHPANHLSEVEKSIREGKSL